jgi:hypothetical protein
MEEGITGIINGLRNKSGGERVVTEEIQLQLQSIQVVE